MATRRRHQNAPAENGRSKQSGTTHGKSKQSRRRDRENGHYKTDDSSSDHGKQWSYVALVGFLALFFSWCHRNHISGMFESDRHFSHLSSLERELAFRTEMGLYYSYYKTIIEAPSFKSGVQAIMYDNITEYPDTINTLKRFNLYPEVVLGFWYRLYEATAAWMNIKTKTCWKVNRGEGLSPVQSCEGLGEPSYFYIECVFSLNGLNMGLFFLFGTYLSGSVFGGILTVMSFFYNHGECTRVQWTPPLRESFAYAFLVLQMFIVTHVLKLERPTYKHSLLLAASTVCFMLPWQFAQFALMTQAVAVFACYVLLYIGSHKMKVYLCGQGLGLLISYVCLFGNEMLLTSFFTSCLISISVIILLEPVIEKINIRFFIWVVQGILWVFGTIGIKILLSKLLQVADDAHIGDIFRSKFTNFKNFHTQLYVCAAEFDFMESEVASRDLKWVDAVFKELHRIIGCKIATPWRLLKTFLLPVSVFVVVVVTAKMLQREYLEWCARRDPVHSNGNGHCSGEGVHSNGHGHHGNGNGHCDSVEELCHEDARMYRSKPHAEVVFHFFQLVAFSAMAIIIMRLKLFWTPHLCLVSSLLASREFFGWFGSRQRHISILVAILAVSSIGGYVNLQKQWSIFGEFSNMPMEQMVEWINTNTPQNAVFAGPMPTMATVKLSTGRPIVNHPHYEDAGLRARTKKVYSMYSRKEPVEVWQNIMDLQVDYVILEESWCVRRSKPGCGMAELWDLEDVKNRDKPRPVCAALKLDPKPYFSRVFRNDVYDILKVNKTPRTQR